jgi:hypothetical protein
MWLVPMIMLSLITKIKLELLQYRPARGLYTLLTYPDLVGHNLLGNLCKCHVASLCNHTSVVWYGALQTPHGWVQSSSELLRCLW